MDLSKLPRLSKTDRPPSDSDGPADSSGGGAANYEAPRRPAHRRVYADDGEGGMGPFLEIWLSAGLGLLFVLLGLSYGKYVLNIGDPYPLPKGTGMVWAEGSEKAGQEV